MATDFWEEYKIWNELIAERYLKDGNKGKPIYLDIDDTDLEEICSQQGWAQDDYLADYISVVADTLTTSVELYDDPLEIHVRRSRSWMESPNEEPPPFLALLGFFSYAAFQMVNTEDTAAHNYYTPLTALIFGEDWTDEQRSVVQKGYVKYAPSFWQCYARWLEATMHGDYGNPTAESLDRRVNIKYPLSQAILNAQDRLKLYDCFAYGHLRPGERLSTSDMQQVLSQWIPGSPLSSITKSIWKKGGQHRDALCQIAVEELIAWDGMSEDATFEGRRTGNLILLVDKSEVPVPSINYSIGMRGRDWSQTEYFEVIEGTTKPYQDVSGITINELTLKRTEPGLWEITESLSIADLIGSLIRLKNKANEDTIRWTPRKFLVLDYDDELRRWVDTGSTTVDKAMIILAHESYVDRLCSVLAPSLSLNRPLTRWESSDIQGLPENWVMLSDVWLDKEIRTDQKEFVALNSKSMSARIELDGGMKIPNERVWLRSNLPTISLAAHPGAADPDQDENNGTFKLQIEESSLSETFSTVTIDPITDSKPVSFSLKDRELPIGHYRITLEQHANNSGKKSLASAHIGVCSSDAPMMDKLTSNSTLPKYQDPWYPTQDLIGYGENVSDPFVVNEPATGDLPPAKLQNTSDLHEEDYIPPHQTKPFGKTTDCAHYTILPPNEPGRNPWVYGNCQYCGTQVSGAPFRWGSRDKNTNTDTSVKLSSQQIKRPKPLTDTPLMSISNNVDHDTLFEACCYMTSGTFSEFVNLLRQASQETIYPSEVLNNLYSLGHLDIWREDPDDPVLWRVNPPEIVISGPENAYIAGYRSARFITEMETHVINEGGSLSVNGQPEGPAVIAIDGLGPERLNLLVSSLRDEGYETTRLTWAPCLTPDITIPARSELLNLLPVASPPNTSSIFDPESLTWEDTINPEQQGLHRLPSRPVQHRMKVDGGWRSIPYRLGKHMAGHLNEVSLMAYDPDTQTISCSKGSQLPSPYDKIAAMCTGKLPGYDLRSKEYRYEGIPASTAAKIWGELYA